MNIDERDLRAVSDHLWELERQVKTLRALLRLTVPALRQWCAEYSRDPADQDLLKYIEALPDDS